MPTINFRISPSLHERLLKHCEASDKSVSDTLRELVERVVDGLDDLPTPAHRNTVIKAELAELESRLTVRRLPSSFQPISALDGSPIVRQPRQKQGKKP